MTRLVPIVMLAALAGGCRQPTPEVKVINDATEALGGKSRIQALKTVTFEGGGTNANLGQGPTPEGELPKFDLSEIRQTIDLEQPRLRLQQVRTAKFPYLLPRVVRQHFNLDGDIAYNVGADGTPTRASERVAIERRLDRLHHPVSIVRAALEEGTQFANLREHENKHVVEVTTPKGDKVTLAVDKTTHLPVSVTSQRYDLVFGDVAVETKFEDYGDVDGLKLPMHLTSTIDRYPQNNIRVTKYILDADAGALAAPDAVKTAALPPLMAAPRIDVQQVGDGVWSLGGQSHHSVLVAFADHTVLIETPQNEVRAMAVIAAARDIVPNKPLMKVIVTHHHADHTAGIRAAVSEGLTLVAHESSKAFLQDLIQRRHAIYKDALSQNPRRVEIETVGDHATFKDDKQTLELYHVDTPHAGTMLMAYLPKDRIIVQGDLYSPTFAQQEFLDDFLKAIGARKLKVARHVAIHGPVMTDAEFRTAISRR